MEQQQQQQSALLSSFLALMSEQGKRHTLRTGIDYYDNKLWYGFSLGSRRFFLASGFQISESNLLPNGITAKAIDLPSPLSKEGMERYLLKEQTDGKILIAALEQYFRDHAQFQFNATSNILAHWALGTYLYMAFPTYAYIWINSATKQSGKSRALELIAAVSFRSPGISINPTQAVVYRSIDQEGRVFIVDEFEQAKDDSKVAMIQIFNAGFRAGATIQRCRPNDLQLETFNAYCPKVFAGLNSVPDTLSSRAIQLRMFPKAKKDNIKPFSPIQMDATLRRFRDDMAIWALHNAEQCAGMVLRPSELHLPECLDDRAADFMAPLYAISKIAGSDRAQLDDFCVCLAKLRHVDSSNSNPVKVLAVLSKWFPDGHQTARIHLETVVELLGREKHYCGTNTAGEWLRELGLEVKQMRIEEENKKGTEISRSQLEDLLERYNVMAS